MGSIWRITDMKGTLADSIHFNADISKWGVSRATDMSGMFTKAAAFDGDLSKWDVSSAPDTRECSRVQQRPF